MKFLANMGISPDTVKFLREEGHRSTDKRSGLWRVVGRER
jgi:hypothetical protein